MLRRTSLVSGCSNALPKSLFLFFFNDTATTEIYTLSLHDALPICYRFLADAYQDVSDGKPASLTGCTGDRSEEHTSELQSHLNLVCRLLLEKKKTIHAPQESAATNARWPLRPCLSQQIEAAAQDKT